jgi:hypothetical protein
MTNVIGTQRKTDWRRGMAQALAVGMNTALLCSCGPAVEFEDSEEGYGIGAVDQAIINGTGSAGLADGRFISILRDSGFACSGSLIRPNLALTAAHCFQDSNQNFLAANRFSVRSQDGATVSALVTYLVSSVDVAIAELSTPIGFGAGGALLFPGFAQISAKNPPNIVSEGQTLFWAARGANTLTQTQCLNFSPGGGSGTLRQHSTVAQTHADPDKFLYTASSNRGAWRGDSGSSYHRINDIGTTWEIIDVLRGTGPNWSCIPLGTQWGADRWETFNANQWFAWARNVETTKATSFLHDFSSNQLVWYSILDEAGSSGGASTWAWSSGWGGVVTQSSNTHKFVDGVLDGTKMMWGWDAAGDVEVSVSILSTDNDAGGIVFHMHNATRYYMFTVDEERRLARLVRREGSTMHQLASATISSSFKWSDGHTLKVKVIGPTMRTYLDGVQIHSKNDWSDMHDGHSGVVLGGLGGGGTVTIVDNFRVQHSDTW